MSNFDMKGHSELRLGDIVHLWQWSPDFLLIINVDYEGDTEVDRPFYWVNSLMGERFFRFSLNKTEKVRVLKCH